MSYGPLLLTCRCFPNAAFFPCRKTPGFRNNLPSSPKFLPLFLFRFLFFSSGLSGETLFPSLSPFFAPFDPRRCPPYALDLLQIATSVLVPPLFRTSYPKVFCLKSSGFLLLTCWGTRVFFFFALVTSLSQCPISVSPFSPTVSLKLFWSTPLLSFFPLVSRDSPPFSLEQCFPSFFLVPLPSKKEVFFSCVDLFSLFSPPLHPQTCVLAQVCLFLFPNHESCFCPWPTFHALTGSPLSPAKIPPSSTQIDFPCRLKSLDYTLTIYIKSFWYVTSTFFPPDPLPQPPGGSSPGVPKISVFRKFIGLNDCSSFSTLADWLGRPSHIRSKPSFPCFLLINPLPIQSPFTELVDLLSVMSVPLSHITLQI